MLSHLSSPFSILLWQLSRISAACKFNNMIVIVWNIENNFTTYRNHVGNYILNIVQHFISLKIASVVEESNFISETFQEAFGVLTVIWKVTFAELERDLVFNFFLSNTLPGNTTSFCVSWKIALLAVALMLQVGLWHESYSPKQLLGQR